MTEISEGYTYEYLVHGILIALVGLILSIFISPIFILILLGGILMTASKTGIQVDAKKHQIRKYVSWVLFKTGNWISLKNIVKIELKFNTQHTNVVRPLYLNKADTTAKTYDLILIDDVGHELLLNEFTKAGLVFKTLKAIEPLGSFEIDNQVAEILVRQRERRKQ